MPHYLNPKNHYTFKRVFGEHKHLCMSLLNSMLPLDKPIVSLEYQTGELLPKFQIFQDSIVNAHCIDSSGRQFVVELQRYWTEFFTSRVSLNASKACVKQLDKDKEYKLPQPVYSLNFVTTVFERSPEKQNEYYHHYKTVNIKDTEKQIKDLELVFIELPKFRPQGRSEKKLHELWLRFFTEISECTQEAPPELLENSDTREALQYVEISAYTKKQLVTYDRFRDFIMTERSALSDAWDDGVKIGREERKKERIKEIAISLLQMGIPLETIMQCTRLTEDEIRNIAIK